MPKSVEIRVTIPFSYYEANGPDLCFTRWLPETPEAGIVVPGDRMSCRYWADKNCIEFVSCYEEGKGIPGNIEMLVGKVRAAVEGISVTDEMGDLILRLSSERNWVNEHLHKIYDPALLAENKMLVQEAYLALMEGCNNLIAHCRALKGQYWINTLRTDVSNIHSEMNRLGAKVRLDDSEWVRCTCAGYGIVRASPLDRWRLITEADWKLMETRIANGRRPPLVGTLLTIAEELEDQRHYRAALIEAVSALEIAVSQFVSKSDSADWFAGDKERFGVSSIKAHREHMGFTGTVSYLFPMIFTEEQVPTATLKDCREAIEERNNVIHSGQRTVDRATLGRYLKAIRGLCDFLMSKCKGTDTQ